MILQEKYKTKCEVLEKGEDRCWWRCGGGRAVLVRRGRKGDN
jgi:hypothetical protein